VSVGMRMRPPRLRACFEVGLGVVGVRCGDGAGLQPLGFLCDGSWDVAPQAGMEARRWRWGVCACGVGDLVKRRDATSTLWPRSHFSFAAAQPLWLGWDGVRCWAL